MKGLRLTSIARLSALQTSNKDMERQTNRPQSPGQTKRKMAPKKNGKPPLLPTGAAGPAYESVGTCVCTPRSYHSPLTAPTEAMFSGSREQWQPQLSEKERHMTASEGTASIQISRGAAVGQQQ